MIKIASIALRTLIGFESCCRFEPTCSNYAHEAFKTQAWPLALWLTVRRILSCRPGGRSGFDPVH